MKTVPFQILILLMFACSAAPAQNGPVASPETDRLLKPLSGRMRLLECEYRDAVMLEPKPFVNGRLINGDSEWSCKVKSDPLPGDQDAVDLTLSFRLERGMAGSSGIAVAFDFNQWSAENYVMIPASVYNGNRNRIVNRSYAEGLSREDLYKKDLPLTTADLPQLSPEPGKPSKIEVTACNATTPAICFYDKIRRRAFILLAEQGIRVGNNILDNGLIVEESPDRSRATLMISAPGVRSRKPEFIGFSASPDRATDWISFGWVGGLMDTYPMLVIGDETHLNRVTSTFDFAIPRAQGKAGDNHIFIVGKNRKN